ncbi:hypothetical protein BMETH_2965219298213, partial [methanotrophic bacterial endosymbiont of Bathymodiolus sp.]
LAAVAAWLSLSGQNNMLLAVALSIL